jgi:hypothetical protein
MGSVEVNGIIILKRMLKKQNESVPRIQPSQDMVQRRALVNRIMRSSIPWGECRDQLNDHQLPKND